MAEVGADGTFACGEISADGLPVGEGIPSEDDLFASLNCQKGGLTHACMRALGRVRLRGRQNVAGVRRSPRTALLQAPPVEQTRFARPARP